MSGFLSSALLGAAFGGSESGSKMPERLPSDNVTTNITISASPNPLSYLGNIRNIFGGPVYNGGVDFDRESRIVAATPNKTDSSIAKQIDIMPYILYGGLAIAAILIWKYV